MLETIKNVSFIFLFILICINISFLQLRLKSIEHFYKVYTITQIFAGLYSHKYSVFTFRTFFGIIINKIIFDTFD